MSKLITLSSGYKIPSVGLGVYLTEANDTPKVVYKSLEIGYRHVDSAQFYKNEAQVVEGIATFLKDHPEVKRSDIFYTTKVDATSIHNYDAAKKSIEESLQRAKSIEYIDLFLIHAPLGGETGRLGSYKALQEFQELGKIKSIGVSNYGIHHLKELLNWSGLKVKPVVNQIELNPWLTRKELVDFMKSEGILAEAYSPLTRGYRLDDPELKSLAAKYKKSTAQILIKWSLQKGFITLPKSVTESRLIDNFDVFDWELSEEDFKNLTHDDQYYVTIPQWDPVKGDLSL